MSEADPSVLCLRLWPCLEAFARNQHLCEQGDALPCYQGVVCLQELSAEAGRTGGDKECTTEGGARAGHFTGITCTLSDFFRRCQGKVFR